MRVLVTGANGLLGRCVVRALKERHEVTGTYHTRPLPDGIPLAIDDRDAVASVFHTVRPTHVVHCAANRNPDDCLDHPEEAYRVNALAVEYIGRAARDAAATLCYISTDYVFGGDGAPYREDDLPGPVNLYGRTKLAGEQAAREAGTCLIARIPALYRLDLDDPRNVAAQFAGWLRAGEARTLDAETVRYYTLADEVAAALCFLLETGREGVIHLSATCQTSKADFARRLARFVGADPALVTDGPAGKTRERRPFDSHLDTSLYLSLGGPTLSGVDKALA